ncbi:MAG: DUF885 domain-containing protein [Cyclobacteriaceae bacterium]|nr:DUF885 domain-containing protein [Cyclobacteriaceae bacterium]
MTLPDRLPREIIIVAIFIFCFSACTEQKINPSKQLAQLIDELTTEAPSALATRDFSIDYFENELAKTKQWIDKLEEIDTSKLSFDERIDWQFAHSILAGRELEQGEMKQWKKNPRLYMAFTQISGVINRPGNMQDKISEIEERLKIVPRQLANGVAQLQFHVPRFRELSLFMAENGVSLFDKELPEFISRAGTPAEHLTPLVQSASRSLIDFIEFLKNELPNRPTADFAIGEPTYNRMLANQYLMNHTAETLYKYGWDQFNKTLAELEEVAERIDTKKSWRQLAIEIKNEYPEPHRMIEAHQEWVDKSGEHIKSHNLIPIPWKERVKVVPRAEYLRKTSYYGNFSIAKGKDNDSVFTSEWMINPFEDQWDDKRKQEYLVEHDWGVIIVTAPHETYGGHHVQGLYQMHNPSKLRRKFGISYFSEGWGLYNEQLMQETGFFPNEKIHLRQLQLRLWRNARVIYDVGIHTGRLSYEDAIKLMRDEVGFLEWAAQLEVDACCARPGYFIGYFMGMMDILEMRDAYQKMKGDAFKLADFHESLLKIGNMPPSLMRMALLKE